MSFMADARYQQPGMDISSNLKNLLPGAALGGLGFGALFGKEKKPQMKKFETLLPQQKNVLLDMLKQLSPQGELGQGYGESLSGLREMLDPSSASYQRFSQPYLDEFQQQTVPGLAERFAGYGGQSGALSSSGFGQALSSAGSNLQTQLAGMKASLQQQALRDILDQYTRQSGLGLGTQSFGYLQKPGRESFGQSLLTSGAQFLPSLAQFLL